MICEKQKPILSALFKKKKKLTPVILATWEAETGRIMI
jgi:hypothetical protein